MRGGQGVVVCSELLALAAYFDGKFSGSFPLYGAQRRGGPLISFTFIGEEENITRSQITNSNYLLILDSSLFGASDIAAELSTEIPTLSLDIRNKIKKILSSHASEP